MNALYTQHFRRTTPCPNLEMCTFASDSKSEHICTLEHTFSRKLHSFSLRGSSGALSPSTRTGPKDGPCPTGITCWFSCLGSLRAVQPSGNLQISLLPMQRNLSSSALAVIPSTGRCFRRPTLSETTESLKSSPSTWWASPSPNEFYQGV